MRRQVPNIVPVSRQHINPFPHPACVYTNLPPHPPDRHDTLPSEENSEGILLRVSAETLAEDLPRRDPTTTSEGGEG
ncbi:hypothetical protein N7457_003920 [Penicillium paradoxum]|uniref:uncharacterized protein n=1 Tax=Penicillium paradoxum TaxID=176176 RepID=UPI002546A694|nr:uncharacterized protein N7457_003920 [Penicillium paradoxum]KAJ5782146.1 hypothetical protein N7457_003920 [Penicillium paradoxum]